MNKSEEKPVLFLDVDGVALSFPNDPEVYKTHPKGVPSNGLWDFLNWAVIHMDCRWLTSWAPWGVMNEPTKDELIGIIGGDRDLLYHFDHHHPWGSDKTQAVDATEFLGGKLAFWLDDDYCKGEQRDLKRWGLERIFIHTDTSKDPDALLKSWAKIREAIGK